jgi:hypothetical protein
MGPCRPPAALVHTRSAASATPALANRLSQVGIMAEAENGISPEAKKSLRVIGLPWSFSKVGRASSVLASESNGIAEVGFSIEIFEFSFLFSFFICPPTISYSSRIKQLQLNKKVPFQIPYLDSLSRFLN